MIIKTFDNVISKDLLKYVQFELQYLNYFKHESIEGDGNIFFNSITDDIPSHKFLFKIFNKKFNLNNKLLRTYVNCYPPRIGGRFHDDDGDYTYLFFPDECENIEKLGDLQFQNGPTIAYKTNRLVIFDAKLFHKANQNLTDHYRHTIAWKTST